MIPANLLPDAPAKRSSTFAGGVHDSTASDISDCANESMPIMAEWVMKQRRNHKRSEEFQEDRRKIPDLSGIQGPHFLFSFPILRVNNKKGRACSFVHRGSCSVQQFGVWSTKFVRYWLNSPCRIPDPCPRQPESWNFQKIHRKINVQFV